MYDMTSFSRMFARVVVLTIVASNRRQARLFALRGQVYEYMPEIYY